MEQTPVAALPKSTRGSRGQQVGCKPALCPRAGLCELEQSQQVGEGHCSPLKMLGDTSGVTERCLGLCGAREVAPLEKLLRGSWWRAEHQACEERLEKLGLFRRRGTNCHLPLPEVRLQKKESQMLFRHAWGRRGKVPFGCKENIFTVGLVGHSSKLPGETVKSLWRFSKFNLKGPWATWLILKMSPA